MKITRTMERCLVRLTPRGKWRAGWMDPQRSPSWQTKSGARLMAAALGAKRLADVPAGKWVSVLTSDRGWRCVPVSWVKPATRRRGKR